MIELYIAGIVLTAIFNNGKNIPTKLRWMIISLIPIAGFVVGMMFTWEFIYDNFDN